MTHPTPDQLTRVLSALARIKAGDGGAPGLDLATQLSLEDLIRNNGDYPAPNALAHLLDVCMGAMNRAAFDHSLYIELANSYGTGWKWRVENTRVTLADGYTPTHLSAAIEVVCAIADVVGEKEGVGDE